ncbi:MAG: hypothetical protein GC161_17300 [Planctomycetaceae bacterium]|nr:hypothetical protein [Planctomycetaceae bacterium]
MADLEGAGDLAARQRALGQHEQAPDASLDALEAKRLEELLEGGQFGGEGGVQGVEFALGGFDGGG